MSPSEYQYNNTVVHQIKRNVMKVVKHKKFAMGTALAALMGFGLVAGEDVMAQQVPELPKIVKKTAPIDVYCTVDTYMVDYLATEHGEYPIAMSLNHHRYAPNNTVGPEGKAIIWFTNKDRSSFSIVADGGMGVSCLLLSGNCESTECFIPSAHLWVD